jgi:hypothetical protein
MKYNLSKFIIYEFFRIIVFFELFLIDLNLNLNLNLNLKMCNFNLNIKMDFCFLDTSQFLTKHQHLVIEPHLIFIHSRAEHLFYKMTLNSAKSQNHDIALFFRMCHTSGSRRAVPDFVFQELSPSRWPPTPRKLVTFYFWKTKKYFMAALISVLSIW